MIVFTNNKELDFEKMIDLYYKMRFTYIID